MNSATETNEINPTEQSVGGDSLTNLSSGERKMALQKLYDNSNDVVKYVCDFEAKLKELEVDEKKADYDNQTKKMRESTLRMTLVCIIILLCAFFYIFKDDLKDMPGTLTVIGGILTSLITGLTVGYKYANRAKSKKEDIQ